MVKNNLEKRKQINQNALFFLVKSIRSKCLICFDHASAILRALKNAK
jgi:hypothetical protein